MRFRQRRIRIVADTVPGWQQTRQQGCVGRKRQRPNRVRPVEHDTLAREPFEMRHRCVHQPVRRETIGACRVQRDEEHVQRPRRPRETARQQHEDGRHERRAAGEHHQPGGRGHLTSLRT